MARVALDGKVAGDFYWKTQIQITGNTSTLASSPRLVDLFVEWQKYKAFNLRLGEFQVPFTFESPIHPIDVGFMDNGQAVLKLTGYSDRSGMHSSNGRDIGIMAQGDFLKKSSSLCRKCCQRTRNQSQRCGPKKECCGQSLGDAY